LSQFVLARTGKMCLVRIRSVFLVIDFILDLSSFFLLGLLLFFSTDIVYLFSGTARVLFD
jgi:hypothetical protein